MRKFQPNSDPSMVESCWHNANLLGSLSIPACLDLFIFCACRLLQVFCNSILFRVFKRGSGIESNCTHYACASLSQIAIQAWWNPAGTILIFLAHCQCRLVMVYSFFARVAHYKFFVIHIPFTKESRGQSHQTRGSKRLEKLRVLLDITYCRVEVLLGYRGTRSEKNFATWTDLHHAAWV